MKKKIIINKIIYPFKNKSITVSGDKSLSIRFILLSSLANGKSSAINILKSEDVINTIKCIKKLGIKVKTTKSKFEVFGKGLFGYKYKNNLILNAGNSGTAARLLCSILVDTKKVIKITGDNSLKKRDMKRIIEPLKMFGAKFEHNNYKLPIKIFGTKKLKAINYTENLGSAQCKSAIMLASLKTPGVTKLKCLPSRNHTELMFKNVIKTPISIKKEKNYDLINLKGLKQFKSFNYEIPGDISSAAFFIILTLLAKNSSLKIKNVNINNTRIGIIKILNKMGAKIKYANKKKYKGEQIADIIVKSNRRLNSIKLNPNLNSSAIDEFLLIFIIAGVSKGISTFRNLSELNKKESKRLDWGIKILKMVGIKVKKIKNDGLKIHGNPNLKLKKKIEVKNYLKDHRVFMTSVITALTLGGEWRIHDADCFKTSFPSFFRILRDLGAKTI